MNSAERTNSFDSPRPISNGVEFSGSACIAAGWRIFKERPWFFIGVILLVAIIGWAIGAGTGSFGTEGAAAILGALINFILNTLLGIGITAFMLKAHDSPREAGVSDLWHPRSFLPYLAATILNGLIVVIGLVLLIVPGIILALMLIFTPYIVVDRELGPIKALKESARMTKGHWWELFILLVLVLLLNIVGAVALLVGLLVTIPTTSLAIVHAYRTLSKNAAA